MKHLTTYKLYESFLQDRKEIRDYVSDLFSGIISEGVRVFVYVERVPTKYKIVIGEYSDQVEFKYSDISSEVEHIKSYFINEGDMRLGDVAVDVVGDKPHLVVRELFGNGKRLLGWEKLEILSKEDPTLYSISIEFERRGGSFL